MDKQLLIKVDDKEITTETPGASRADLVEQNTNSKSTIKAKWKDVYPQILSTFISYLFIAHAGIYLVYANIYTQYFDIDAASYTVSLGSVVVATSIVISGPIADKFGRKPVHIIAGIPCIVSWIMYGICDISQVKLLLVARLLASVTTGFSLISMVYVTEIAHKDFRGMLSSASGIPGGLGTVLVAVLAFYLNWKDIAWVFTIVFILITLLIIFYLPESPFWLLHLGGSGEAEARKNLEKLNPNINILEEEWSILKDINEKSTELTRIKRTSWKFSDPTVYKPICLLLGFLLLHQLTGSFVTLSYFKYIVIAIGPNVSKKYDKHIFIVGATIRLVSNTISTIMVKNTDRKTLLIYSAASMVLTSLPLIVLLLLSTSGASLQFEFVYAEELRVTLFLCFTFANCVGVMLLPWSISPELLPPLIKGTGFMLLTGYSQLVLAMLSEVILYLMKAVGVAYVFIIFAISSIIFVFYVYYLIPKTADKHASEMNNIYKSDVKNTTPSTSNS